MSKTILVTVLLIVAQFSTIIRDWITRTTEFHLEKSGHDISDYGETKTPAVIILNTYHRRIKRALKIWRPSASLDRSCLIATKI